MPTFYVPARIKGVNAYHGHMPQSMPTVSLPHFGRQEEAEAYLRTQNYQDPYYGDAQKGGIEPMTYGPNQDTLTWPKMEAIYYVEIQNQRKLEALELSKPDKLNYPGISQFAVGKTSLDPSNILYRQTTIGADALHKDPRVVYEEAKLGQRLSDREIAQLYQQRCEDLDRLHKILERSLPKERESLDMSNPEHMGIIRKICMREQQGENLAERTLTQVQRDIAAQSGVRTVLSLTAVEQEFKARMEALPPETAEAERVAIAMTETLQKFAATVPTRDAAAVQNVSNNVRGIVNNLEAEQDGIEISKHELGEDEVERMLRPYLKELPDEEQQRYEEQYQRELNARMTEQQINAAVKAAAAMATITHLIQEADPAVQAWYGKMQEALGEYEHDEHGDAADGVDEISEEAFREELEYTEDVIGEDL